MNRVSTRPIGSRESGDDETHDYATDRQGARHPSFAGESNWQARFSPAASRWPRGPCNQLTNETTRARTQHTQSLSSNRSHGPRSIGNHHSDEACSVQRQPLCAESASSNFPSRVGVEKNGRKRSLCLSSFVAVSPAASPPRTQSAKSRHDVAGFTAL